MLRMVDLKLHVARSSADEARPRASRYAAYLRMAARGMAARATLTDRFINLIFAEK